MAVDYSKDFYEIRVQHKGTGEVYSAQVIDDREDGSIIFQIVGNGAQNAKMLMDNDNLEIDTLFSESWVVLGRVQ